MAEQDLTAIGALIDVPEAEGLRSAEAEGLRSARGRRRSGRPPGDRLNALADWWTTVAGSAGPTRVEQLWLTRPSSVGPARADVRIRRFDAPDTVEDAIGWGISTADDAVDDGTDLILLSVPSTGPDDVDWQVLTACLLGLDAVEAMGWPGSSGLSDPTWIDRVGMIRDGLRRIRGLRDEPRQLLDRLGSAPLAAATGLLLQAGARRTPALLDGPRAAACALLVARITESGRHWWQASDDGDSALTERIFNELRLPALTRLGLRDEDGTAARISLGLLETAVSRRIDLGDDELTDELMDDEPML